MFVNFIQFDLKIDKRTNSKLALDFFPQRIFFLSKTSEILKLNLKIEGDPIEKNMGRDILVQYFRMKKIQQIMEKLEFVLNHPI